MNVRALPADASCATLRSRYQSQLHLIFDMTGSMPTSAAMDLSKELRVALQFQIRSTAETALNATDLAVKSFAYWISMEESEACRIRHLQQFRSIGHFIAVQRGEEVALDALEREASSDTVAFSARHQQILQFCRNHGRFSKALKATPLSLPAPKINWVLRRTSWSHVVSRRLSRCRNSR